jgi:DNA-binding response OmpR family regulator
MGNVIAVVDDEPDILELVSIHLKKANFKVREFADAEAFLKSLDKQIPDLLILDLMLPDADGMDICKYLKKKDKYASIPVIMLTAKTDETDKVLGLELGADDYVTKPFSPRELVARVRAVLRRKEQKDVAKKIEIGNILVIDLQKFEVRLKNKKIDLTTTEFKILKILAVRQGWVFSREQILNELWGTDKIVIDRTIDVHIKNLREKLGKVGEFIKNVRGVGYKLEQ